MDGPYSCLRLSRALPVRAYMQSLPGNLVWLCLEGPLASKLKLDRDLATSLEGSARGKDPQSAQPLGVQVTLSWAGQNAI